MRQRHHAAVAASSTDRLIAALTADVRPVRPTSASTSMRNALVAGAVVATALFFAAAGVRADLATALLSGSFWFKLGYAAAVAALAWRSLRVLGRPEAERVAVTPLLLPVCALAVVAALQAASGRTSMGPFWLGSSWSRCPFYVSALAVPMTAGLLWAFRGLAPTRPRTTGFLAGLVSGAVGAALYSLRCGETSAGFVLLWYSLGMVIPAAAGAAVSGRLLRW